MIGKGSDALLLKARPLGQAQRIARSTVGVRVVGDDPLLLTADPAWAGAIHSVLVEKGVRVHKLCRTEDR